MSGTQSLPCEAHSRPQARHTVTLSHPPVTESGPQPSPKGHTAIRHTAIPPVRHTTTHPKAHTATPHARHTAIIYVGHIATPIRHTTTPLSGTRPSIYKAHSYPLLRHTAAPTSATPPLPCQAHSRPRWPPASGAQPPPLPGTQLLVPVLRRTVGWRCARVPHRTDPSEYP